MLTQPYKEYGLAHSDISYDFRQSSSGFSGRIPIGPAFRGLSQDPSSSGRNHFAIIDNEKIRITKTGFYAVTAQFLLYLKFNPSNGSSFLMTLGIGSSAQAQLGYTGYSGGTYSGLVNNFLQMNYQYLSAAPLETQVMTAAFNTTTTFEVRGLCSYHSTKLRLNENDNIDFTRIFNGTTTFDWIMNGNLWVEKLS
jgi:hypothetical protein